MSWKLLQSRENHQVFEFGGLGLTEYPLCPTLTRRFSEVRTSSQDGKRAKETHIHRQTASAPCVHVARCYCLYMEQNCIAIYKTKQNCNPPNIEWNSQY